MKRTVLLIITLIILATALLIYAVSVNPSKKPTPITLPPTAIISPSESAADTILFLSPENTVLQKNGNIMLDVQINTGKNQLTGVQLEIAYDPELLTNILITPGSFFPTHNILLNNIDRETGRISYAIVIPPTSKPISGTGIVAKIQARKSVNTSSISQTGISILPKSLVSQIGVEGSVLKETKNASITFLSASTSAETISTVPTIKSTQTPMP